jgi:two-component system sensor histidine kinase BaeS
MEPVNLSEVLQHEAHKHHCRLAPLGILLAVHCPKDLFVSANPNDLKSVVSNLLSNAVKSCAAGDGGQTTVNATSDGNIATIKFTDTGLGFEESEGERIFERFYRPGDELRRETTGSGLGLYLVSQLTRAHGGTARAESPGAGLGATITITWPATSAGAKS